MAEELIGIAEQEYSIVYVKSQFKEFREGYNYE